MDGYVNVRFSERFESIILAEEKPLYALRMPYETGQVHGDIHIRQLDARPEISTAHITSSIGEGTGTRYDKIPNTNIEL